MFSAFDVKHDEGYKKNYGYQKTTNKKNSTHDALIHEAQMCDKMLPKRSSHVSDDEAVKIFDRLVMQGKLRSACRFITERDGGVRVMPPEEDARNGKTVFDGLLDKHPEQAEANRDAFENCNDLPFLVDVDITGSHIEKAARSFTGGAGPSGVDGDQLSAMLLNYGSHSIE